MLYQKKFRRNLKQQLILWRAKLALAQQKPGLASTLLRQMARLRPRFLEVIQPLLTLANVTHRRRVRRWFKRVGPALIAGSSLALILIILPAHGANITVNSAADVINSGDGACTLREAIINANNDDQSGSIDCLAGSGADVITLPSGIVTLTLGAAGEDDSAEGDLDLIAGSQISINGAAAANTIIDGNAIDRVFHLQPGAILNLSNLTVRNGNPGALEDGGGIYNDAGALTLTDSTISGNTAENGGGILNLAYNGGSQAQVTISNSTISNNTAGDEGGAIFSYAYESGSQAQVTLTGSTVSGNRAADDGGGIINYADAGLATLTLTDTFITGNRTDDDGGGIYSIANAEQGQAILTVTNSTVFSNTANGGYGGGIYNYADNGTANVTITNSTISSNKANSGGGIENFADESGSEVSLTLVDSTISGNTATNPFIYGGGGIENYTDAGAANLIVTNSAIISNTAYASGGGVFNYTFDGLTNITVTNSTISGNLARFGGGIFNYSSYNLTNVMLTDSTISGNTADIGGGILNLGFDGAANLNLTNGTVSGNSANYYGGGLANIVVFDTANVTVTNSTISNNMAVAGGGLGNRALLPGSQANLEVVNSTISGNTTDDNFAYLGGGGIENIAGYGSANLSVTNSTVSGNRTNHHGGGLNNVAFLIEGGGEGGERIASTANGFRPGVMVDQVLKEGRHTGRRDEGEDRVTGPKVKLRQRPDANGDIQNLAIDGQASATLINTTITNNTADHHNDGQGDGGGIYQNNGGLVTLQNSLIAGNFDTPNSAGSGSIHPDASGGVTGNANNLVGSTTGISGTLGSGSDIVTADPKLAALADNGHQTQTHALGSDSPARNAGDNTICAAPTVNNLDQRGQPRPGLGSVTCDIGAYEFQMLVNYLPFIFKNSPPLSDLTVESLVASSNAITVVIKNEGLGPVNDAFWVDAYVNPITPPTGPNQEWHQVGSEAGLVWGLTDLPIAAGQRITLTLNSPSLAPNQSSPLPLSIRPDSKIYAQVDSANTGVATGGVLESDETNNILGPELSTARMGAPPLTDRTKAGSGDGLPLRDSD